MSTASMMWTTPLDASTSAVVTLALLIKMSLLTVLTVTVLPSTVLSICMSMRSLACTAPLATWYVSRSTSCALFSGLSRLARTPLGRAANASLLGAKTVNGPLPERVSTRPPALSAATRVERSGVATARSTIDLLAGFVISIQPKSVNGWAESKASCK